MNGRTMIHAFILGAFCLGAGVVLATTDLITFDAIKERRLEDRQNSLAQVMPSSLYDNNPVLTTFNLVNHEGKEITVYQGTRNGKVTAVAYEIFGSGYAGEMRAMLGVDPEGKVLGVRMTFHKETPGLGDWIEEKKGPWITKFTGLFIGNPAEEKWKVKKDGGIFDQFAGATITPRGVVKAVRVGLHFFDENKSKMLEAH